jgi:hypothetical protein
MKNDDPFDGHFHSDVQRLQKYFAVIGLLISLGGFFLVVFTLYFFLAAAGVVPPMDVVPVIPYI